MADNFILLCIMIATVFGQKESERERSTSFVQEREICIIGKSKLIVNTTKLTAQSCKLIEVKKNGSLAPKKKRRPTFVYKLSDGPVVFLIKIEQFSIIFICRV
jgi:hypothetical protein